MLVGHTKFSPDWCFGLFKQRYRRTFVSSLGDIAEVVNTSADVNVPQLVGTQTGEPVVTVYDWATFLGGHFRSVPQLKSYHHFSFTAKQPGVVVMQEYSDSAGASYKMMCDEWTPLPNELPHVVRPSGLSLARQWYLHRQIREYCREGTEDLVCPMPSRGIEEERVEDTREQDSPPPPPPKKRRCGKCGGPGHTRRTCKED
jgi:hypothetical protein